MDKVFKEPLSFSNFPSQLANPGPIFRSKKGLLHEFQEFALRGNVMDMAIGIIMGVAFGRIVASFVEDILTPLLGFVLGRVDFTNLFVNLSGKQFETLAAARAAGAPTLSYGVFLNTVFNFLIVAFAIFMMIRQVNRLHHEQAAAPAEAMTRECPFCCAVIPVRATRCAACTSELLAVKTTP